MMRTLVIIIVLLLIGFPAIKEVRNFVENPSVQTIEYRRDGWEVVFYHRGTRDRRGTLLIRPTSGVDKARPVVPINASDGSAAPDAPPPFESICWTRDRSALFATVRGSAPHPDPELLWVYDIDVDNLMMLGEVDPGSDGVILPQHLAAILHFKSGPGEVVAHWFELGSEEGYIHWWEAKHWDKLAAEAAR